MSNRVVLGEGLRQVKTKWLAWSWGDGEFVNPGIGSIALETPKNKEVYPEGTISRG